MDAPRANTMARLLVDKGANLERTSFRYLSGNITALEWAAYHEDPTLAIELLRLGANARIKKDEEKFTPLHNAAFGGNIELVKLLLDKGADVNAGKNVSKVTGGPAYLESPWNSAKDEMDTVESDAEKEIYKEILMVLERAGGHSTKHEQVKKKKTLIFESPF